MAGVLEPLFLQAAVCPPTPWAGISVRVLCQREESREEGRWVLNPGVARRSNSDSIVSASRGAEVAAMADVLPTSTVEAIEELVLRACGVLAESSGGDELLEVGVDVVIDYDYRPHLIEVNSRPWGRLKALVAMDPQRFGEAHEAACLRPFRYLAARFG